MNKENTFYCQVKDFLKENRKNAVHSKYLSRKEKVYLVLLGTAPKFVRQVHRLMKGKQE